MICDNIISLLQNNINLTVKVIIAHIREKFNYTTSYRKEWIGKNKAMETIFGNWEDSYTALPQWLVVMHQFLPGTIIRMETVPSAVANEQYFHRLFWAFRPCIEGLHTANQLSKLMEHGYTGSTKGLCCWLLPKMETTIFFPSLLQLWRVGPRKHGASF
jgi:hypothetical protein